MTKCNDELVLIKTECETINEKSKQREIELSKKSETFELEKIKLETEIKTEKQIILRNHKKTINDLELEHAIEVEKYEKEIEGLTDFKNKKIKEDREQRKHEKKVKKKEKSVFKKSENKTPELDTIIDDQNTNIEEPASITKTIVEDESSSS